jgi:tripartite-type tricarboxylate transporter receptor subunit TctC
VVPFPPGGSADILARVIAQKMSDILEQPVLVDNKAGASGAIATDFVAKSSPDGYTLIFATASTQVINPAFSKVPFDPVQDFTPVGMIGTSPLGLIINSEVPASGVQDLVVWLRANPGKVNFASFGNFCCRCMNYLDFNIIFRRNYFIKIYLITLKNCFFIGFRWNNCI